MDDFTKSVVAKISEQIHTILFILGLICFLIVAFMIDIKIGIILLGIVFILLSFLLSRAGGE